MAFWNEHETQISVMKFVSNEILIMKSRKLILAKRWQNINHQKDQKFSICIICNPASLLSA